MRLPSCAAADWQDGAPLLTVQLPIMTLLETAFCSLRWCHLDKENGMELEAGATNTLTVVVDESMTADRFGNSGVQVLATPCWSATSSSPRTSSPCGRSGQDRGR
jgi:hypothetical protein